MGFDLRSVFSVNSGVAKLVLVKFVTRQRTCAVLREKTKQAVNLSVHQDGGRSSTEILETLEAEASSLKSECHAIRNKYPEAASVVQVGT
jgi:hypothetical protein